MEFRRDILTYVIVTAVTLLIWVWAATETREQQSFSPRVEFIVPDPENWRIEPVYRSVTMHVQGSRLALDRIDRIVRQPIQINITPQIGTKSLDLLTALREHPDIEATGALIQSSDPVRVDLRMDEIVRVSARVRTYLPRVQTVGEIEVEPREVTVALPRGLRQQFPNELFVEPVINPQQLDQLEPEVRRTIEAELRLADGLAMGDRVTISPSRARVTLAVRSRIRELTLDSVRVQLAGPPEDHRDYVVEIEDAVLRDVTIQADSHLIDQIEQREALVVAVLHVSSREKEQQIESKRISYFLVLYQDAAGLMRGDVVEAQVGGSSEPPVVRLRIDRKDAS